MCWWSRILTCLFVFKVVRRLDGKKETRLGLLESGSVWAWLVTCWYTLSVSLHEVRVDWTNRSCPYCGRLSSDSFIMVTLAAPCRGTCSFDDAEREYPWNFLSLWDNERHLTPAHSSKSTAPKRQDDKTLWWPEPSGAYSNARVSLVSCTRSSGMAIPLLWTAASQEWLSYDGSSLSTMLHSKT